MYLLWQKAAGICPEANVRPESETATHPVNTRTSTANAMAASPSTGAEMQAAAPPIARPHGPRKSTG